MSSLIRRLLALVALLVLSGCGAPILPFAAAPAPTAPPLIPVPTRAPLDTAAIAQSCDLSGEMTLGAVVSLSGPASSAGASIKRGIDLAVSEINQNKFVAPAAELVVIYEDDESNPESAAAAFTRLIEESAVLGILGPTLPASAFAADPIAQKAGVPVLDTSTTVEGIAEIGSYIFRNSIPETIIIPSTLGAVRRSTNANSVILVYDALDPSTNAAYDAMRLAAIQQEMEIVGEISFESGARTFGDAIEIIEKEAPDLIMVSALLEEASSFIGELRAKGIDTPVMGGNGFNSANLYVYAAQAANGAISGAAWSPESQFPENIAFVEQYRTEYGSEPDQLAAQAYTGTYLYAYALRNGCSTVRSNLRNALADLRLVPTPLGNLSFTVDRNPLHPPVVLVFEDGKQVLFEE